MAYDISEEKFIIAIKIKNFIRKMRDQLKYLPKNEIILKDRILSDSYDLLELVYMANFTKNKDDRDKLKIRILTKISMIDFYYEEFYKNKFLSEKQISNILYHLETITKMVYRWINNECKI